MAKITGELMAPLPPVFVMNVYYTGIGVARNLCDFGVEVFGLSSEHDAPGMHSRSFRGIHMVPNGRDDPEALYQRLMQIRAQYALSPLIFPTRDADLLFLNTYAERLKPYYQLPPLGHPVSVLMDKLELAAIAKQEGIPLPNTKLCTCERDVDQAERSMKFPLVIKPRSAHEWRKSGVWQKVGGRKAILVETAAELANEYRFLSSVSPEILVQEYVAGDDSEIVVCCCYISRDGRWIGHYTGRKLRQNPPLFGTGCLVEATPIPTIVTLSQRLLKACGYSGLAEVEFKRDADTGRYLLIEVNPRHWDQHELGKLVGVNLSWIAYCDSIGRPVEPCSPVYRSTQPPRWIAEREALLLIARNTAKRLANRNNDSAVRPSRVRIIVAAVMELRDAFRKPRLFSILSSRDPIPGALFLARLLRDVVSMAIARKTQKT